MSGSPGTSRPIVAVSGLVKEARIAAGPGVRAIAGGGRAPTLIAALEREIARGASAVISFGIAGGLAEDVASGTWLVARAIVTQLERWPCDAAWARILAERLPGAWSADLAGVKLLEVSVGQRPFNFQLGDAPKENKVRAPTTPDGELEARLDNCEGKVIATLPLAPAVKNNGITTLRGALLPQRGRHDICLSFTGSGLGADKSNPLWLIDRVRIASESQSAKPVPKPERKK